MIPSLLYAVLAGVALGFWCGREYAVYGVAVVNTAMLLLTVRNECDLVTWLAPRADGDRTEEG